MEISAFAGLIALISTILVTLTTIPVQARARCSGKWRIHACFGGNGKRSDQQLTSDIERLTIASKLREARKEAIRSAVEVSLEARKQPWSLIEALQHKAVSRQAVKDLASEFADWLQETAHSDVKDNEPILESSDDDHIDNIISDDITREKVEDDKVDVEEVRDLITALTLQHVLRSRSFIKDNSDSPNRIVL